MPEKIAPKTHQMKLRNSNSTKKNETLPKKKIESEPSNDDSDSSWVDEEDDDETYEEEQEYSVKDFRELLSNMFPSKYIKEKAKNTDPNEKLSKEKSKCNDKEKTHKKCTNSKLKSGSGSKYKKEESDDENEESETLGSEDTEEDEYDDEEDEDLFENGKNFNIILTVGDHRSKRFMDEEYDEEDEEEDSDYEEEEEGETTETEEETEEDEKSKSKTKKNKSNTDDEEYNQEIINKFRELANSLKKEKTKKNSRLLEKFDKLTKQTENEYKKEIEKKNKARKIKNLNKFKKLLSNNNVMNDVSFFREKLTYTEQCNILKELEEVYKITKIEKPYRLTLLESNIPTQYKSSALRKINQLRFMEPGSGEYYKIKNWVDTFMQIPFGIRKDLPITIENGVESCHEFIENAKSHLDSVVYGLNDAKLQIMQMLGQFIVNPDSIGTAIAIQGPMGTGKTTLVKEGISKILNRDFAFIALGGATDSSFLEGHSYTYEGSTWGKIVDILIKCKSMNPIIYFDELDKVSETPKGDEIIGILTHLTDTSQNSKFHDKYFSEIDFDLSKCLFIFSYNDESKINPILRDRMYRIHTSGYNKEEKTTIVNSYLLPKINEQIRFNKDDITIPTETIHYMVEQYTQSEDGVRNLKRCLEIIYTKLNLYRLMKPGTNLFEKDMSIEVKFPLTVTKDLVDKLIKKDKKESAPYGMYT